MGGMNLLKKTKKKGFNLEKQLVNKKSRKNKES